MTKKHVAVLMGGMSSEREVSLSSGKGIVAALEALGYQVTSVDPGRDTAEVLARVKPDVVFNALHGPYGEDGCIPGLLEVMGIPYTHSGVLASALGMDKVKSRDIFMSNGIRCAEGKLVHKWENHKGDPMPRPYVAKPLYEGSSIGVEVVFEGDDFDFAKYTWPYGDSILVERYIPGREIQVAVLNDKAIGAIEIRPKGRFYDYEAKYTEGKAEHIMPAPISKEAYEEVLAIGEKVHTILGCRSVSRVDFRYDDTPGGDGNFYILEINTHPGFTPLSLVPEIAAYNGITYAQLVDMLVKEARCDK